MEDRTRGRGDLDHESTALPTSLGAQLALDRLLSRVARLEGVTAALRARAVAARNSGRAVPSALAHSLDDFEAELDAARAALREATDA